MDKTSHEPPPREEPTPRTGGRTKVGILIAHNFDLFDHLSAYATFALFPDTFDLVLISAARDLKPVKNYHPGSVKPDCTIYDAPAIDILVIGAHNQAFLGDYPDVGDWLNDIHDTLTYCVAVCAGSGIYAEMGFLNDRRATFTKGFFPMAYALSQKVKWVPDQRWVTDGRYWTSSGVSAGLDCCTHFIASEYIGEEAYDRVQERLGMVITRDIKNDPYKTSVKPWVQHFMAGAKWILRPIGRTVFNLMLPTWDSERSIMTKFAREPLSTRKEDWLRKIEPDEKRKALVLVYDGMDILSWVTMHHHVGLFWEFCPILLNAGATKTSISKEGVQVVADYDARDLDAKRPYDWLMVPGGIPKDPEGLTHLVKRVLDGGRLEVAIVPAALRVTELARANCKMVLEKKETCGFKEDVSLFKKASDTCVGPKFAKSVNDFFEIMPENVSPSSY